MSELARRRSNKLETELVDVNRLIGGLRARLVGIAGAAAVLATVLDDDVWSVRADAAQLEQAVCNLVANASEALANGGHVTLETRNTVLDERSLGGDRDVTPGGYVQITVSDDGCGIAHDDMPHIFDPLFTTRDGASGLGLTAVVDIVRDLQGIIDVRSEERIGTAAHIYLPRATAA